MPKAPQRRLLTGARRRMPYRMVCCNERWLHLSAAEVWTKNVLSDLIELQLLHCVGSMDLLEDYFVIRAAVALQGADTQALDQLIYHHFNDHIINQNYLTNLMILDTVLYDIPQHEEILPKMQKAPRQLRISDFSDTAARNLTRFNVHELLTLFDQFGFEQYAAEFNDTPDMMIPIPTGHVRNHTQCRYLIHAEELFLFTMIKVAHGFDNAYMVNNIFGGHISRWSHAYRWAIMYLDHRYASVLSHAGLLRFVDQFPVFNAAIEKECQRTKKRELVTPDENGNTWIEVPGLLHLPFDIVGFINDSIDRCSTPMSGPRGDYAGAARKAEYEDAQQAFYTGYKKIHGIKVETIHLPNGMSFLFGPVSARHNDAGLLQMSNVDNYLAAIQDGKFTVATADGPQSVTYSVLGDSAFNFGLQCVQSYFTPLGGAELTEAEIGCNFHMKSARMSIEHSYGQLSNLFKICHCKDEIKLGKKNPYALEQLRVCHLLQNCHACFSGSSTSNKFLVPPPTINEYLFI
jgi:hypothetical protein